jgi:hypothetical protein
MKQGKQMHTDSDRFELGALTIRDLYNIYNFNSLNITLI